MQKFCSKTFESLNDSTNFVAAPEKDNIPFFKRTRRYARKAWKEEEFTCIERYRLNRLNRDTYKTLSHADHLHESNLKFNRIFGNPSYDPLWEN